MFHQLKHNNYLVDVTDRAGLLDLLFEDALNGAEVTVLEKAVHTEHIDMD